MRVRHLPARRLGALLLALGACRGDQPSPGAAPESTGDVGGTLVLAVPAPISTMLPTSVSRIEEKLVTDLLYERLAEIGPELSTLGTQGFEPMLAREWSWGADSLSITFRLAEGARWHDGRPVTSEDVRFTVATTQNPEVGAIDATYLRAIDSVTTPDSATAVFWFSRKYPEQFYDAAGRLSILPAHLLRDVEPAKLRFHPFGQAPVGSGRFRFVRAAPGSGVVLAADTAHHLGRARLDRVVVSVASDPVAATTQLLSGQADVFEAMRPENMRAVAASRDVVTKLAPSLSYGFLVFNLRDPAAGDRAHPIFADAAVRRALSMAVDREAAVRTVFDTLGLVGVGPFPRALSVADTTLPVPPHDPRAAGALLDSLGWRDADGDGVRERGGRPLAFTMLVPTSSAFRQRVAVVLQQQLAAVGARLDIRQLDNATMGEQMGARRFDVALLTWQLTDDSPSGLRSTWGTGGAQNFGRYASPVFDAHVDSGNAAFAVDERRAHFRRAFEAIVADAPAIWLYEPRSVIGVHARFRAPALRPAAWWLDLHRWWIPAAERIERDGPAPQTVARR